MMKNDTLKNGTYRTGLYGSVPPPACSTCVAAKLIFVLTLLSGRSMEPGAPAEKLE